MEVIYMPFTVSHIAAVVPLKQLPLCFPALVIGSMSPDFTYVIELFGPSIEAHSIYGIFYFCLPASSLVLLIYDRVLKGAWENLLPWLRSENQTHRWYVIAVSIVIGAATHVVWDSFTHRYGYAVIQFDALQWRLFTVGTYPVTIFKILQHGSTVVGGCIVALAVYNAALSKQRTLITSKRTLVILIGATILATLLISTPLFLSREARNVSLELFVMRIPFRSLAALAIVVIAYPLLVRARKARKWF